MRSCLYEMGTRRELSDWGEECRRLLRHLNLKGALANSLSWKPVRPDGHTYFNCRKVCGTPCKEMDISPVSDRDGL